MTDFNFIQPIIKAPEEGTAIFDFGASYFNTLEGSSNLMTAIWASPDASLTNGKMYVTSFGEGAAFSVMDLKVKALYDRYTKTIAGRTSQKLRQDDPIDMTGGS